MDIDLRQKEDIIQQMRRRAAAYVPQWRFDRDNPDLGTALALMYGELFTQTLKRYNQVPEKNRVAFFSHIGAKLLPALPAEGFVSFALAGAVDSGEAVAAHTQLLADVAGEETTATFETMDDILVTAAELEEIFTVCGHEDYIASTYTKGQEAPCVLFDPQGENRQHHCLCLAQDTVLHVSPGGRIVVTLVPAHRKELPFEVVQILANPQKVVWEYTAGERWVAFEHQQHQGNTVTLTLGAEPLTPTVEGVRQIRLRLLPGTGIPTFALQSVTLAASNENLVPEHVFSAGADGDVHKFFLFGEQLGLLAEGYFGCDEALVKAGAQVSLRFQVDFVPIPVDYDGTVSPINWKLVMKKADFKPDEEFDVSVQEVLWEYFNGNGWARLFPDNRYSNLFAAGKGALGQRCQLDFTCPKDMRPALVGSGVGYYIRARALKVSNLYKRKGYYMAPLIGGSRFAYDYAGQGVVPQSGGVDNNCQWTALPGFVFANPQTALVPFVFPQEKRPGLYLRFSAPPSQGPVKLLLLMSSTLMEQPGRLLWQYYGVKGWETLLVMDESESFRQTGVLTLLIAQVMPQVTLWGQEGYWVRALDEEGRYFNPASQPQLPRLAGVHMNTTRIRNVASREPERFFIETQQQKFTAQLRFANVVDAEVWVDEKGALLPSEMATLDSGENTLAVYDGAGVLQAFWVRWEQREDFDLSHSDARHYTLDKQAGIVKFSDGIHGKIPPSGKFETIEVRYVTGGGKGANVDIGAVNRAQRSLGYVSKITNPRPTVGGCDGETLEEALRRGGSALRHGDRAVTASDFEQLALEATRSIVRAKCFPNRNGQGKRALGHVTVVALLREYQGERDLFPAVRGTILNHLRQRCGANLGALEQLHVVAPTFLELRVRVELSVQSFHQVFSVRQEVERRLTEFLHPLTGNFHGKGWEIGQIPNETQLRNCLSGIAGMVYLKHIAITAYTQGRSGPMELTLDDLKDTVYALPCSGTHGCLVSVE